MPWRKGKGLRHVNQGKAVCGGGGHPEKPSREKSPPGGITECMD